MLSIGHLNGNDAVGGQSRDVVLQRKERWNLRRCKAEYVARLHLLAFHWSQQPKSFAGDVFQVPASPSIFELIVASSLFTLKRTNFSCGLPRLVSISKAVLKFMVLH